MVIGWFFCKITRKVRKDVILLGISAAVRRKGRSFSSLAYPCISGKQITPESQYECLADVMTPLWQVPYTEQLNIKNNWTEGIVKNLASKLKSSHISRKNKYRYPTIEEIKPSPVTEAYRNKSDLHIRTGIDGNPKTLGFYIGSPAEENVVCVPGTYLLSTKQSHKDIAEAFQNYLRQSKLPACHDFNDGGYWRGLVIRSTEAGETMAVAVCHPRNLTENELKEQQEQLREFFVHGYGKHCTPDSLFFQACPNTRCTHQEAPFIHLHGHEYLTESLGGLQFRISPDSFFQMNVPAAEVLYSTVLHLSHLSPITTLLDVCCGTGTISLLASSHVRGCVGVETIADAVKDAEYNAKVNNIHNVQFYVGRVEKRLRRVLQDLNMASDIVAVLNPSRQGYRFVLLLLSCFPWSGPIMAPLSHAGCPSPWHHDALATVHHHRTPIQ
ncbi:tRNA (uracil-5-)-methyltransferase homolog B isoform X2 [Anabrus simplex]|uniref:tRNA (uracil-5-)-methyltransferase homolog B isoform X2 n=1 Tax=Anabrus simplex TaxID=316456 RepID=UPI0035A308EE